MPSEDLKIGPHRKYRNLWEYTGYLLYQHTWYYNQKWRLQGRMTIGNNFAKDWVFHMEQHRKDRQPGTLQNFILAGHFAEKQSAPSLVGIIRKGCLQNSILPKSSTRAKISTRGRLCTTF